MELAAVIVALLAQSASAMTGRVVADETGSPIANARVSVTTTSGLAAPVTLTDADGRFSLPRPASPSVVVATKTGYTRAEAAPSDRPIEVRLTRGGVISGRVVDEFGEPVENVRVAAQADAEARIPLADGVTTDDRGEYRLTGLPAGLFIVSVTRIFVTLDPATGRQRDPDTIFYPATTSPIEAKALPIAPGDEQRRIDFVFPARRPEPPTLMVIRAAQSASQRFRSDPAPAGVIRGRVVEPDGRAVPHAMVQMLSPADVMQWQGLLADDRGVFEFRGVAAGVYQVVVVKNDHFNAIRMVTIADGGVSDPIDIQVERFAAVTGRVVDELGEPVERVNVEVMQIHFERGRRRLNRVGSSRLTDDDGRFRIFGLRPGQYIVSAVAQSVASAELPGYARAFYPGTTSAGDARTVGVAAAQETGGVDFALSRTRTFLVAGRVLDAGGSPTTGGTLQLVPASTATGPVGAPIGARVSQNGAFEFPNVTPGRYVIRADRGRRNVWTEGEFGTIAVAVADSDVTGLVVPMSAGSAIHGRIRFDSFSGAAPPSLTSTEISPVPSDFDLSPSQPANADIHEDGSFDVAGVNGPRRIEVTRLPKGWALDAVRIGGIDVTDRPIPFGRAEQSQRDVEVVLTDRISELAVMVVDDRDQPAAGAVVIAFSTDKSRWYDGSRYLRRVTAGSDGEALVSGLPFGTFYVAAPSPRLLDGDAWQDPQVLDAISRQAATFIVREGQRQTARVRTAGQ